jgi:hypothetical protein
MAGVGSSRVEGAIPKPLLIRVPKLAGNGYNRIQIAGMIQFR